MINTRRKQEPIFSIEPLFICRIAPRFTVAGYKMNRILHTRDAAFRLDNRHAFFKETLPFACPDECLFFRFLN